MFFNDVICTRSSENKIKRGGGGEQGVGEEKDELHVCLPSSDNSLLNIVCKVLYTLTNPFYQDVKVNSPK